MCSNPKITVAEQSLTAKLTSLVGSSLSHILLGNRHRLRTSADLTALEYLWDLGEEHCYWMLSLMFLNKILTLFASFEVVQ